MSKAIIPVTKKTHAYILEDGTVVRAINPAHVDTYTKEKKNVYSAPATKTVDGAKVETENFYVSVEDFVKRTTARASLKDKLAIALDGKDLSTMSAADVIALLG